MFDRIAFGRALKRLVIVGDVKHEPVVVVPEHTIGGDHLPRILDGIARNAASQQSSDGIRDPSLPARRCWPGRTAMALHCV